MRGSWCWDNEVVWWWRWWDNHVTMMKEKGDLRTLYRAGILAHSRIGFVFVFVWLLLFGFCIFVVVLSWFFCRFSLLSFRKIRAQSLLLDSGETTRLLDVVMVVDWKTYWCPERFPHSLSSTWLIGGHIGAPDRSMLRFVSSYCRYCWGWTVNWNVDNGVISRRLRFCLWLLTFSKVVCLSPVICLIFGCWPYDCSCIFLSKALTAPPSRIIHLWRYFVK